MSPPEREFLAVEALPAEDSPLMHRCAEGHTWIEQPDGTVSSSWVRDRATRPLPRAEAYREADRLNASRRPR